jgi:hypothetical protein
MKETRRKKFDEVYFPEFEHNETNRNLQSRKSKQYPPGQSQGYCLSLELVANDAAKRRGMNPVRAINFDGEVSKTSGQLNSC